MKKLVIALAIGFMANLAHAACQGPYCYDDTGATITSATQFVGPLRLPVYTVTQINSLLGPTTGQSLIECFNCTQGPGICKSSASAAGSWVILASTGGPMGTLHCQ